MTRRLVLPLLVLLLTGPALQGALKGGCASVDITPPLGLTLIGSKGEPSDAVLDGLYAKALVLSDGDTTIAMVSADLLYTPLDDITNPVRTIVEQKSGIPAQNILVCATHTHSGPEIFKRTKVPSEGRLDAARIDQAYRETVVRKMAGAVAMAHSSMQEVKIGAAIGTLPEVVYNRRPKRADGMVQTTFSLPAEVAATRRVQSLADGRTAVTFTLPPEQAPLTFGPIDPDVFVLRVEDANGDLAGSLIGFGCHPVCVYPYLSTAVSADYPGHATRTIEKAEGGISLFALGLAGNAVPLQRDVGPCAQIGRAVGGEALRRLQFVATTGDVTLVAQHREVTLPTRAKTTSPEPTEEQETPPEPIKTEIQVLRLGDIYILGLPGEILVEVGLAIKEKAGLAKLGIISLANDSIGYVCHAAAYDEGGYESGSATHLAPGAAEILITESLALLKEMKP